MMIKKIKYTPRFIKSFKRLLRPLQIKVVEREKIFKENFNDSRLSVHKLKGELKEYWAFSVNYYCRIMFEFTKEDEILFINIGNHSIYK